MTNIDVDDMTFGVEIECYVPVDALRAAAIVVGGYHASRGANAVAGTDVEGLGPWIATHDGSLSAPPSYLFAGVEFVSPVLKGAAGLRSVQAMCERLAGLGAKVNASTGLHVHVGFDAGDDANAAVLRRLAIHVASCEKAIYAVTGTKRREAGVYSLPVKAAFRGVVGSRAETVEGVARALAADRYRVLNVTNLIGRRLPTVEFRAFAGTTSALKIRGYVALCLGLVQFAHESDVAQHYDAKATTGKTSRYKGGEGLVAVNRLMMHLGWLSGYKRRKAYGVHAGQSAGLRDVIAEFRRLATKYDAVVPAAEEN